MGFLSNLLTRFTGVFSDKKEEVVEPTCGVDCGCEEPKSETCVEKAPELICDVPSTPLQVVEEPVQEAPVVEQPKVEAVVERLVEVSAKDIKEKASKKATYKKKVSPKKAETKKAPSKKKGK